MIRRGFGFLDILVLGVAERPNLIALDALSFDAANFLVMQVNGVSQVKGEIEMDAYRPNEGVAVILLPGIGAKFDAPGIFAVDISAEGYETTGIITKKIAVGSPSA